MFHQLLFSDLLPLNNPEHPTSLHCPTRNYSSDFCLVPTPIASKCTWQTLPDLGSNHLSIFITIPTSSLTNSTSCLPHSTTIKPAGTNASLILTLIAHILSALLHSLFQKSITPLPNSSMMLPLLPFLLATSITLLKPGGLLKLQKLLQNTIRHTSTMISKGQS